MPLMLRPAEPSDLPRIVQLENASFADSPLTPILFPNGQPPDAQDAYVESLRKKWTTDTASRHMVVVDTNLDDKIIAFARWSIYVGDDVRFIKTDLSQKEPTPGSNVEAHNEYFGGLLKFRVDLLGKKEYCYLSALCTDPQHQRRGAGSMLVQWGCDIAQKHGIPAYLEASPAGLSMYKKCGFQEVDKFVFNLEKYGASGSRVNVHMIKYPESASGITSSGDVQNDGGVQR